MVIRLVLRGHVRPDDVPALCAHVRVLVLLARQLGEAVECDAGAVEAPDVCAIDALARMQLTASRLGGRIVVIHATDDLRGLLDLTGLAGSLLVPDEPYASRWDGSPNEGYSRCVSRKKQMPEMRSPSSSSTCSDHGSNPPAGSGLY